MIVVHGVDLAEAGDVAVLDVHAWDVVFALRLCLGAVLLEVVHRRSRDTQAGALPHRDAGCCVVQAEHIAVDDVAGEHKASQALFFVNGHLRNGGLEGSVRLAGEADLHTGT